MLGICTIYLIRDGDGEMLAQQNLERIARHTSKDYRIYAICLEDCEPAIRRLAGQEIRFIPIPADVPDQTSLQHSTLLDVLVEEALADGCSEVACFDNDSWPVRDGWDEFYGIRLTDSHPVVAIARTEIGDNFPLAAFTMFRREFWKSGRSSFGSRLVSGVRDEFLEIATRPKETGSGILAQLRQEKKGFLRLEKSNIWEPHYVMAAVYDGTIFHFGSGSRKPWFVWDHQTYHTDRNELAIEFARRANDGIRSSLLELLSEEPEQFLESLVGAAPPAVEPIPTYSVGLPKTLGKIPVGRRMPAPDGIGGP